MRKCDLTLEEFRKIIELTKQNASRKEISKVLLKSKTSIFLYQKYLGII